MEWIEVTAKTVAAAVDLALDRLGVDEADVEYEVVEEPRKGIFGLGGSSARIRARVKPISRAKPERRRRSGGREGRDGRGGSRAGRGEGRRSRSSTPPEASPPRSKEPAPERRPEGDAPSGRPSASRQRRPGRENRPRGDAPPQTRPSNEEESVTGHDVPLEEQVDLARQFTTGLIDRFGVDGDVTARVGDDDDVRVEVSGSDLGLLIGPKAATLDALQELVRTAVQRRIGGYGARIHVDVAGYRARRQAALANFAREAAGRALESGRDQAFEPMSASDRKVIHDTANEIEGVSTFSEGEEPRRRVVIQAG